MVKGPHTGCLYGARGPPAFYGAPPWPFLMVLRWGHPLLKLGIQPPRRAVQLEHMTNRHPIDMVVYMYLNTVTEMTYVGSSKYGLEHRHRRHLKDMKTRRRSRFYNALTEWPECFWDRVILEQCSTEAELDAAEKRWIAECCALEPGVGYNSYDGRRSSSSMGGASMQKRSFTPAERQVLSAAGKKGAETRYGAENIASRRRAKEQKRATFAAMSAKERAAFFRESGKKGAKPRSEMTEAERERYRAWGRQGAARSKQLKEMT